MLKNAMNFLGEVAATVNGSNGDEADYSPTSNDHIVGSVVDVGGIQVCISLFVRGTKRPQVLQQGSVV